MTTLIRPLLLITLFLALSGCKQSVQMDMNLQAPANFFSNGFPTNLRVLPDGHIDLSDFPRQQQGLTRLYVETTERQIRGYALSLPVYLPFTGSLAWRQLPDDEAAFASPDSPIQLIDIDPASPEYGRRYPLRVTMTWQPDSYRPNHLLELLPTVGLNLRPNTVYAAIVTSAMGLPEGIQWQQNATLHQLLTGSGANGLPQPQ